MNLRDVVCVLIGHNTEKWVARCGHCGQFQTSENLSSAIRFARLHVSRCPKPGTQEFLSLRGQRYEYWFIGFV